MRSLAFYKKMRELGMDEDMALRVAEEFDRELKVAVDEVLEPVRAKDAAKREKDAARQAAKRASVHGRHAESRGVTRTSMDETDGPEGAAPARVREARVVNPSSSLRSEEVVVGGDEGASAPVQPSDDWPDLKPTELVPALVALVASPWLDPDKSLALHTSSSRLAAWRRAGASWEHDVLPVVKALCAKQRSKISSWSFFDEAIARSIRDNRAALEIPAAQPRSTGPPSITDRIAAENAEARRLAFAMLDARNGSKN